MATFVEITPDAFNQTFAAVAEVDRRTRAGTNQRSVKGQVQVRRPVRGIWIKDDTYGTIQVRTSDGRALPMFDAAGRFASEEGGEIVDGFTTHNSNFLIQSVQEQRVEKSQIILTFGAPYIFFFGEQPRVLNVSGVLLNTVDFNWRAEWWENYDKYLRGTACVRSKTRVYLSWDDVVTEGYILSAACDEKATEQNYVSFQFQMFLTNYQNISGIGQPDAHLNANAIDLDPEAVIASQNALSSQVSSTVLVRNRNIQAVQMSSGQGVGSLFASLRNGEISAAISAGTSRLVEIQGQVVDILSEAGRFVSGRNIRVPIGFEGSAVFDDAQLALASIPGASQVITGNDQRTVSLGIALGGVKGFIEGSLGLRSLPARYGPLHLNEDEFIARRFPPPEGASGPVDLFRDQFANDLAMGAKVRDVFAAFGVEVDPPSDLLRLIARGVFGVASIPLGSGLLSATSSSGTARFAANLL